MAKQKAYELRFVFPTFQDLKDFVSLHTKDGHTYREADVLDLTLPSKNYNLKRYVGCKRSDLKAVEVK